MTDLGKRLLEVLRKVRDVGALDDNNGATDWTYSDSQVDKAKAELLKLFQEWAESCVSKKYNGTIYGSEYERGRNEAIAQTLNNIRGKR